MDQIVHANEFEYGDPPPPHPLLSPTVLLSIPILYNKRKEFNVYKVL